MTTRVHVHLGSGEEGERRRAALLALARRLGAIVPSGPEQGKPSIGRLLQMIADGEVGAAPLPDSHNRATLPARSGGVKGLTRPKAER